MLSIQEFRQMSKGLPDLLNPAALIEEGILLNKDGSLTVGILYRGPDGQSVGDEDMDRLSASMNHAFNQLGTGWTLHVHAIRNYSEGYIDPRDCFFPDPVSRAIDAERRRRFEKEGSHLETRYALTLTWRLPSASEQKLAKLVVSNPREAENDLLRHIRAFRDRVDNLVGILRGRFKVQIMGSDDLLTHYHECLTGLDHLVRTPTIPMYLDAVLGHHDAITGFVPQIAGQHIQVISFMHFPQESHPDLLEQLTAMPWPLTFATRFIFMDPHEAVGLLGKYRRNWFQKRHGIGALIAESMGNQGSAFLDQDAMNMAADADSAVAEASSGVVRFGYYSPVVILRHTDEAALRQVVKYTLDTINNLGFVAQVESVNAMEALLGSLPGHTFENIRRPLIHTLNLADLLPKTAVWAGPRVHPNPFYRAIYQKVSKGVRPDAPVLAYGETSGFTPFRLCLHDSDVGHTLIFGPTGCHAKGHPILMADGRVLPVEAVAVGDRVMGTDGRARTVLRLHRGISAMVRIIPIKGEPFVVNADHILSLKRGHDVPSRAGEIVNLTVSEYLQKSRVFKHNHKLYRCPVETFENAPGDLPMSPYLLGVILGDGSCGGQTSVRVTNPDKEIAQALYQEAVGDGFQISRQAQNGSGVPNFGIVRGALQVLRQLDCMGKTAATKRVPEMYKRASREDRLELLAGLLDTDGSLYNKGFDYISKSRQLAEDVVFLARSLGLSAYVREAHKSCQTFSQPRSYYRVFISGNTDIIPTRIQRKQAGPRLQKKDVLVTGFTVEPAGTDAYYGFELDGDHLYLDGHFMAHHNSGKSTLLALLAAQHRRYPDAQIFAFDKGESLLALCKGVGGQHFSIGGEEDELAFAPLSRIHLGRMEQEWAAEWIETLCAVQEIVLTPDERRLIFDAVRRLAVQESRTITDFANTVASETVRNALTYYRIGQGRGAHLVDAAEDGLHLEKRGTFAVFEMEHLLGGGGDRKIVIPVLQYLFHRIEGMLNGQPTLLILDEAWVFLDNPLFAAKIREWLKVLRKANCQVIFATQGVSDLRMDSPLRPVLMESCPTKILLPNKEALSANLRPIYADMGLSQRQIELVAMSTPKQDYYFMHPDGSRLIGLGLGPLTLAFTGVSGKEDRRRIRELIRESGGDWIYRWVRERGLSEDLLHG